MTVIGLLSWAISPGVGADGTDPVALHAEARGAMQAGRLDAAERLLREAVARLGEDVAPGPREALADDLLVRLPLLRAQQLMLRGDPGDAVAVLQAALADERLGEPGRTQLGAVAARVRLASGTGSSDVASGEQVLAHVTRTIETFNRRYQRYPSDRRELTRLLPPGEGMLEQFDIAAYRATSNGYLVTIRSRADPGNTLTSAHTGLLR